MNKVSRLPVVAVLLCAAASGWAQSSCSSDGVRPPVALLERFINADCESCWRDPSTTKAGNQELALDWIVPGTQGENAPLAAAASRDGVARLDALSRKTPASVDSMRHKAQAAGSRLRVAHGPAVNDYVGTSIEIKPLGAGPWHAWLALVETLPAGTEGSPVERNLVRNALRLTWNDPSVLSNQKHSGFVESRPMRIPEGARPDRLRVVGWVEDDQGRVKAIAQSRCAPAGG
jgi:hypothetical protein